MAELSAHRWRPANRKRLASDILRIGAVAAGFLVAAYLLHRPWVREQLLDIGWLREWSQSHGTSGRVAVLGILAAANGIGVPRLWIAAIAGALYGAVTGVVLSQVATLLGATLNFFTGRWVLRGPMGRRLPDRWKDRYDRFAENGFRWVLYVRLFPLGNATVVNLVSGASRMRFLPFLGATFLGYLPFTIAMAVFGSAVAKQKTGQFLLGLTVFTAVVAGRWIYQRIRSRRRVGVASPLGPPAAEDPLSPRTG